MNLFYKSHPLVRTIRANLFSIFQTTLIALAVVLVVVFLVVMFSDHPKWVFSLLGVTGKTEPKFEALKFVGIGMGGVLVALQALMSYKRAKAMEKTAEAQADAAKTQADAVSKTEQGQRQDRLKNAIEHLGHESDSVRLGGAYELFHLAEDFGEMRERVFEILCAHIRRTTSEDEYRNRYGPKPSEEVQSLLTLLFVRDTKGFKNLYANLSGTWLNGADLYRAHLKDACLDDAYLQGASLIEANLQGAILDDAHLQGVCFDHAHLQGASLEGARLQGAILDNAQLQAASLAGAYLQEACLIETDLRGARSDEFDILSGKTMKELTESNGFTEAIMKSIGKKSDLSGAIFGGGLSQEDVNSLVEGLFDEEAKELREKLTPHIGQPTSSQLPEDSGAITGSYTEEEAEQWIAEYEEAMAEVPEDDS